MNIEDTLQVLEDKGIIIAQDIGEHARCSLDSNCPVAIQVRKSILEAGIKVEDLMAGYQELKREKLVEIPPVVDLSGKATINLAGKNIEVDLSDIIQGQVDAIIRGRIRNLETQTEHLGALGLHLHNTYLEAIKSLRKTRVLPQFKVAIPDLVKYKCYITEENSRYVFLFPTEYKPEYLITNGVRFKMAANHVAQCRRDAYLKMQITPEGNTYSIEILVGGIEGLRKLVHYHGRGNDCWGSVSTKLPHGFTLESVWKLKEIAMRSVATVNLDSLMERQPTGMPHVDELKNMATVLGKEGVPTPAPSTLTPDNTQAGGWRTNDTPTRPGWGNRAR